MKGYELKELNPKAFKQLKINYNRRNHIARKEGYPAGNSDDFYNLEFPEYCPISGLKLDYDYNKKRIPGGDSNGPSYDKIDPSKGYTKGNVRVVSFLGNRMMSNVNSQKDPKSIFESLNKFLTEELKNK